ncbi:AraC family transcriptional regulator [Sinimarinibacterium sp. CAU 1509]|uniref:helix-turn-helix transcriptional regulator n=1 Tax=Sinimarinibacterium sp. CAU 1509 TaxID=2562283 RepID=UPI0010AC2EF5|nr:AraC family transcriptional regulator [Sinimarinibacterium sp. CAU 1509]TJY58388.1 AraC family transcriptional regulator [Sinimarinibacterium sp. CAU 1509]
MTVSSTQWMQLKRLFAQFAPHDAAVAERFDDLVERAKGAPLCEQHRLTAELTDLLGELPTAQDLAFFLGRHMPITAYGDMALASKIAPNFDAALRLLSKFHSRAAPLVLYTYTSDVHEGRFGVGFRAPVSSRGQAFVLGAAAAVLSIELTRFAGAGSKLERIELTSDCEGWKSAYLRHLGVSPSTGHDHNMFVIRRAALDASNPIGDAETFESLVAEYSRRVDLEESGISASVKVCELLIANIVDVPTLSALAKNLHMTPRQLRLALQREATSYRELVRQCRIKYASALIKDVTLPVSQIAYRLGYADLSSFTHSFKRWTGKTPSELRQASLERRQ